MCLFKYIWLLLHIALGGFAAAIPLCSNVTSIAGGGPPKTGIPGLISSDAIKGLQLALFLENLEFSFFDTGLTLIKTWAINGYPNGTTEIVHKVTAVCALSP